MMEIKQAIDLFFERAAEAMKESEWVASLRHVAMDESAQAFADYNVAYEYLSMIVAEPPDHDRMWLWEDLYKKIEVGAVGVVRWTFTLIGYHYMKHPEKEPEAEAMRRAILPDQQQRQTWN